MAEMVASGAIQGVLRASLTPHGDERGRFVETFRKSWFPQRDWGAVQMNASYSRPGVMRGLHYHNLQIDYWFVVSGRVRVGLVDLRPSSPTHAGQEVFELCSDDPVGLYIPVGVAHGFVSLTDVALTYLVDNYYDSTDEYGVAWNDPDIGLAWGVSEPALSPRDAANPRLRDIPSENLPRPLA